MKMAKGGKLYRSVPPTEGTLADAARLKHILDVNFDAGCLFGPARAETWGIVDDWDESVSLFLVTVSRHRISSIATVHVSGKVCQRQMTVGILREVPTAMSCLAK